MSRKKGAAVAIIAFIAAIGGLVAFANMPRQDESSPAPVLTTIDRSDRPENESTTIAETPAEQPQQPAIANGTVIANNTAIANNTIVINKPVYRNNTIIYQPVTINLENYKTIINNKQLKEEEEPDEELADTSHRITINAKRIKSEGWSSRFTDDKVGMFAAVYDINGDLIDTGYADERGFTVRELEDKLYFVFPADCADCNGSKNDIMFGQWEDGSKDRPRLVPADSEVTASYRLIVPEEPKQVPITPPPSERPPEEPEPDKTETAEPEIALKAQNATFVYGWVQVIPRVENKAGGSDEITITVYRPDGTLHDSFSYSDQLGFFASREAGEGDYRIVATYDYGNGTTEAEITHPIKFATPEFVNLVAEEDNGIVRLNGMLKNGIAGENVIVAVHSPSGNELKRYSLSFGTKPVFTLFIPADEVDAMFNSTGNYTFAVTHAQTGVTGNATLFHDANETETAAAPLNVSDNPGRSINAAIAAQGNNVYVVWSDEASGQNEILFAKSNDSGDTFSEPIAIGQPDEGGFVQDPDIAVSGDNVYIVWADYDSDEESTAAFVMSNDAGETFGNKTIFGQRVGEDPEPHVAVFGGDIYVSWTSGAEEEFTGNLMLARSSGGVDFKAAHVAEDVDGVSMVSSEGTLYLAWLHYPTGDSSEESVNVVAKSDNGVDFEMTEDLQGIAMTSLAASGDTIYAAGFANETVILAKSDNGSAFNTTEISPGTRVSVAASDNNIYLTWEQEDEIFIATSSDGGETFGEPENISNSKDISYWPDIAVGENVYVAWTEGDGNNSDIMIAMQ
ncbi:MAG: sialidase family protein [Thermoproteota archaeon]